MSNMPAYVAGFLQGAKQQAMRTTRTCIDCTTKPEGVGCTCHCHDIWIAWQIAINQVEDWLEGQEDDEEEVNEDDHQQAPS